MVRISTHSRLSALRRRRPVAVVLALSALTCLCGCRQPADYRTDADRVAAKIIREKQVEALGKSEPFTIERPSDTLRRRLLVGQNLPRSGAASLGTESLTPIKHWPEKEYPSRVDAGPQPTVPDNAALQLSLIDALQVAACNNRDYQGFKEDVFRSALDLDLENDEFRSTFAGALGSAYTHDMSGTDTVSGVENSGSVSWSRMLKTGASISAQLAVDLVKLLTGSGASSLGITGDATISIPLLRGAGRHIVTEPLTQAERDVVYSIYSFERYKQTLAVRVASEYLAVLQQLDQVKNAEENYRRLIASARRARRLADAGRLPEIQVDQARQDELRARDRWVTAQQTYARRLDSFRITLGLPTDARIELKRDELERLAEAARERLGSRPPPAAAPAPEAGRQAGAADAEVRLKPPTREGAGPLEMEPAEAVRLALERRLDLRTAHGRVYDAQRKVVVAADALRAGLDLAGTAAIGEGRSLGSADEPNARLRPEKGTYGLGLLLDAPLHRTSERNVYRESYISLEQAVRNAQALEDDIKLEIRDALRNLLQARESFGIQAQAVQVAERRVKSTELFMQAGRAQIRDVLEAQEALVVAQNALTAALVDYRVAELELQRDMNVLEVNEKGLWREYRPQADESK